LAKPLPFHPSLYEINTRVLLGELGPRATLDDVPDALLDRLADEGFDFIWMLGVWQTGPAGRRVSRANPDWRREYRRALPDLTEDDICGSPFAVRRYTAHEDFGGDAALARLRGRLRRRGLRLVLDFVPNHTALDHPWVETHPEFYRHGTEADLTREPHNYCRVQTSQGPLILAHGRDPYFPGWPDTLQLDYHHPGLRAAMARVLGRVADLCDGVRCDMAMLVLTDVFAGTWQPAPPPADEVRAAEVSFWKEAIGRVRARYPAFLFLAEAYWDLEWALQQEGFDYTYDKRLYDRLRAGDAAAVRGHLGADADYQRRSARFLENHDEPRAAAAFPPDVHRAAAVVTFLVPGLRFFQEGQLEGRRAHVSMHLARRPAEPPDPGLQAFYRDLLACLRRPEARTGRWQFRASRPAWDGNPTWDRFLAFTWEGESGRLLAAVNYGPTRGQCYVALPPAGLRGRRVVLRDLLGPARYERDGDDLASRGLYLDLPAWGYHVFALPAS
jgi:glycosidase